MPPLSKRTTSPKGYAAQEFSESLPTLKNPGRALGANPFIRCPLPPFNVSPDTLRQFEENGKVPTRRVIPLPAVTAASSGNTIVNNNVTVSGSSSSSGGTTSVTLQANTVSVDIPSLEAGAAATVTVNMATVAVLMILGASDQCEVRIYGDPLSQAIDVSRATDNSPAFESTTGLVSDVVFDTTPYIWNWQNRVFVNQDSPTTSNLYLTVINPTSGIVTPSVTITYLALE